VRILAKLVVVTLVIAVSPQLISGIRVASMSSALLAAVIYGLLFVGIGWLVRVVVALMSIVPGILTFGLFFLLVPFIANAVLLKITAGMLASFDIGSWSSAFLLSFLLSLVNLVLDRAERRPRFRTD
jgi:putative membrane protein